MLYPSFCALHFDLSFKSGKLEIPRESLSSYGADRDLLELDWLSETALHILTGQPGEENRKLLIKVTRQTGNGLASALGEGGGVIRTAHQAWQAYWRRIETVNGSLRLNGTPARVVQL